MKIYTYYEDINFKSQNQLIDLWKLSWLKQGFQPIVLNINHAKNHPYFEQLDTEMRKIYHTITGRQISNYGMSCWFRWLAYATQNEEKCYVSDYDAINVNFQPIEPDNQLHLMDSCCPFLASGKPTQFNNLCHLFVNLTYERINLIKEQANHYHDQEFFMYNFNPKFNESAVQLASKNNISLTRTRPQIGGFYDPNIPLDPEHVKVLHVAHRNIQIIKDNNPKYKDIHPDQLRVDIVKEILDIK